MSYTCPRCNSLRIRMTTAAQKTCAAVGVVGGAFYGFRLGSTLVTINKNANSIAGLVGGAIAGGEAGHAVGVFIDKYVINQYRCNICHHVFSQ